MKKFILVLFSFAILMLITTSPPSVKMANFKNDVSKVDSIAYLNANCEKTTLLAENLSINYAKTYNDSIADSATCNFFLRTVEKVGKEFAHYNILTNLKKNDTGVNFARGGAAVRISQNSNSAENYSTAFLTLFNLA